MSAVDPNGAGATLVPGAGLSNPMSALGDLITGGASGTPTRLGVGAEGEVLTVTGGEPAWVAPAGGAAVSSATPQPIGTAAAGVSADAARADHVHAPGVVTTYAFGDATGVTLENGSVGGSAAVSGGKLVLTCPATPQARYETTNLEGPRGVVQLPTTNGRRPVRWRVRARLAAIDADIVAYLLMCTSSTTRFGLYTYTAGGGTWALQNNTTNSDLSTGTGFAVDGTGWFELEYDGTEYLYARRGTGSGTAVPATWTEIGRTSLGTSLLTEARLVAATYATGVERVVEFDDLTFEALP
jgi:hypothetical protein